MEEVGMREEATMRAGKRDLLPKALKGKMKGEAQAT